MEQEIYILDLVWTFAFSIYWTYFALKKDFDLFWILVSAFLTAVWWWTIRELFFNNMPWYFYDMNYILVIILWVFLTTIIYRKFHKIKTFALLLDSVWLVTFAFIWASRAVDNHLWLFWIIFFSTITAIGWGILRDVILNKTPIVFKYDLYATVAIFLGLIYWLFVEQMQSLLYANLLIIFFLIFRLIVIYKKINLWKPKI